jgi:hypothetical protein
MIWQLLRREPRWLVLAGMLASLVWAVELPSGEGVPVMATTISGMMLLGAGVGRRATLFEAALPIPAPALFTARLLFFLAVIWAPLLTLIAIVPRGGLAEALAAGAILSLAAVFCLTARVEEFASPIPRTVLIAAGAIMIGLLQAWSGHAAVIALVCAVAAAARLIVVWPRIPAGFQAAAIEPRAARGAGRRVTPVRLLTVLPVLRSALPSIVLVMLGVIVLQGIVGGWTYGVIAGIGMPGVARRASRWMWALPISRRTLLALTVLPYVLAIAGGFALGAWLQPVGGKPPYPVSRYDEGGRYADCWRFARGVPVPVTVAPWGETAEPDVARFPGFVLYNPFAVRPDNSKRFLEWQFQRATEAIYGRRISTDEYHRTDRGKLRPISMQSRAAMLTLAIVTCMALFGAFCFAMLESRRFGRLSKLWRNALGAVAVTLGFAPVLAIMLFSRVTPNILIGAAAIRLSEALPATQWAPLGAAIAIVAAAYAVLTWQFRTLEPSQQPPPIWVAR